MGNYENWEATGDWHWETEYLGVKMPSLASPEEIERIMKIVQEAAQELVDEILMAEGILCDCCIEEERSQR